MGTNFYIRKQIGERCCKCGRADQYEEIHVGKSSGGWKFLFNGMKKSFKEWKEEIEANPDNLFDEYGDKITPKDFYSKVEYKQSGIGILEYRDAKNCDLDSECYDEEGYRISKYTDFC